MAPLPAGREPVCGGSVGARRCVVMGELEDPGLGQARSPELLVSRDDPALRPVDGAVARQWAVRLHVTVGRLGHAEKLHVIAGHAVVRVARSVPLVCVAVADEDAAALHQVPQSGYDLRCVSKQQFVGLVLVSLRVAVVRAHAKAKRNALGVKIIRGCPHFLRVAARMDVLESNECAVSLRRLRGEQVEEEVGEDEHAIGLARVRERLLRDVREISRADGPGEGRAGGPDRMREHICALGIGDAAEHDPRVLARPARERPSLVSHLRDARTVVLHRLPAYRAAKSPARWGAGGCCRPPRGRACACPGCRRAWPEAAARRRSIPGRRGRCTRRCPRSGIDVRASRPTVRSG